MKAALLRGRRGRQHPLYPWWRRLYTRSKRYKMLWIRDEDEVVVDVHRGLTMWTVMYRSTGPSWVQEYKSMTSVDPTDDEVALILAIVDNMRPISAMAMIVALGGP